jgi:uncharacterized protein YbbK (DUF523 family)
VIKVLVSSCVLGEPVRYHGGDARLESGVLERWRAEGRLVAACPEVAGGLPVPRPPAEIQEGDGARVLAGASSIVDNRGMDVTEAFLAGARDTLDRALARGVRLAVLKEGSPSCGTGFVYDGSFSGQRRAGSGVTAALLAQQGIRVFSDRQLDEAAAYLDSLEAEARP